MKTAYAEKIKNTAKNGDKSLFPEQITALGKHGTFSPNHVESIHRWYPYLEGFSSTFVEAMLKEFGFEGCCVYDPFAGCGTTIAVSSYGKMKPYYCEINPFMRLVIEAKINGVRDMARRKKEALLYFAGIEQKARSNKPTLAEAKKIQAEAFEDKEYFIGTRLIEILAIKNAIHSLKAPSNSIKNLALIALGAIAVNSSELIRAGDVRYRRENEKLPNSFSAFEEFHKKLSQISSDIASNMSAMMPVTLLANSALDAPFNEKFIDIVITSPPYLNGTNYCRNTKLEMWLTGCIKNEGTVSDLRGLSVAAGINNVSTKGRAPRIIAEVEEVASRLDKVAYDKRIPELVRRYFSDAWIWLGNIAKVLTDDGTAIVDIGDSRFSGIHIPVPALLASIGEQVGLRCVERREVRKRRSYDGGKLTQELLIFKAVKKGTSKKKISSGSDNFKEEAVNFSRELPHKNAPYDSRNWGHGLHSLCSYQGKLKPAIAHFLVERFSNPGDVVLDPMSGSGTIPLEAFLQNRKALGNDLQELGFILTRAKVERGNDNDVHAIISQLSKFIETHRDKVDVKLYDNFGFNGRLPEYFNPKTYQEILAARLFMKKNQCKSWAQAVVYSCLLHILHGNRPYALSRNSHPVTPFKPTGDASYRPLLPRLSDKIKRTLELELSEKRTNGQAYHLDMYNLPLQGKVDVVITSPPFAQSTRFYIANWMRLWMAGWEPGDFNTKCRDFLEFKQKKSMDAYKDFFTTCANWLKPHGRLVMHVGKTAKMNMAEELISRCQNKFDVVHWFDEDVSGREKFGIRDQGATLSHQYLFLRKKGK